MASLKTSLLPVSSERPMAVSTTSTPGINLGDMSYEDALKEVAKHKTETDIWVIVRGQILDVSPFLQKHPGGVKVLMMLAGKDATSDFNMIHSDHVLHDWKTTGGFKIIANVEMPKKEEVKVEEHNDDGWIWATWYFLFGVAIQLLKTIFSVVQIDTAAGITRSGSLALVFIVLHGVGNIQLFAGPDSFCGYGYFMVRLYWTGLGLPSNIMEEYFVLGIFMHACLGIKRTLDKRTVFMKMVQEKKYEDIGPQFHMGISGLCLGSFLILHLSQFRFAKTREYFIRPPPYMLNPTINPLKIWFTEDESVPAVPVRNIYKLEFDVFNRAHHIWAFVYMIFVTVFAVHATWGWFRLAPKIVPKHQKERVRALGYALIWAMAAMYASFVLFALVANESEGYEVALQPAHPKWAEDR